MPGLVRRFFIFAAVDGLLLQPVQAKAPEHGICIEYGTNRILPATSRGDTSEESLEVHGIVGLLNLVSSSYLISITRRHQVAQVRDQQIFRITDVALIPLKSKDDAQRAISAAQRGLRQNIDKPGGEETDESDIGEEAETSTVGSVDTADQLGARQDQDLPDEAAALEAPQAGVVRQSTSFVKDVVQERGKYGRFASRWFSRNGSKESVKRQAGISAREEGPDLTKEQKQEAQEVLPHQEHSDQGQDIPTKQQQDGSGDNLLPQNHAIAHLTPRIVKSARLYFSSSGFHFAYDYDISSHLANGRHSGTSIPLWKKFDPLFFWNRHLMKPFIDASEDAFVMPIMQGFVGQRAFSISKTDGDENDVVLDVSQDQDNMFEMKSVGDEGASREKSITKHDFLLTLISRRSIKRAGLRYLRRGIDDEGNVANSVETEQILTPVAGSNSSRIYSLLQYRGSIPLFFSQSPYSFKPVPVMFGSESTIQTAFNKHFTEIMQRYGDVQATSLVDAHGNEVAIGEAYQKYAKQLNESGGIEGKPISFEWFDFHGVCKGMRFENVSLLLDTLQKRLDSFGWTVIQDEKLERQQTGILRTNCMDCLDRTNVVQSAVAGRTLQQQLSGLGLTIDLQSDPQTQWFNTLWADNGDAISKQYAGTAALKGDFTRTRKRNWTGALSDFSLTLNRYYNNIFGDYFLQTNIDYFLGNVSHAVFDEFETNMTSQDYALDMKHVRQNAIDTCIKIVLEDPTEILIAGWTLSCPGKADTLRALPFEECVLLLTDAALYFCRFNWETEKIGSFERINLLDITELWRGVYITSALGGTHLDESKNVGFALTYAPSTPSPVRTNTRSMSVVEGLHETPQDEGKAAAPTKPDRGRRLLAFKALPPRAAATKHDRDDHDVTMMNETESIQHVTGEINNALNKAFSNDGADHQAPQMEEKDLISVADAKRSTGYLESLGYSLKRMVWS